MVRANPADFDLVITDLTMPVLTGTDLAAAIQRVRADLPVILATGYSRRIGSKDLQAMGADGLIAKPFKNTELIYTLRDCLLRYEDKPRVKPPASA